MPMEGMPTCTPVREGAASQTEEESCGSVVVTSSYGWGPGVRATITVVRQKDPVDPPATKTLS